jgi:hypothetical protein
VPKSNCDCDGRCPRCCHARGEEMAASDLDDLKRMTCLVCETKLTMPGGYYGTGMCGPCCTGESATLQEKGINW